MGRDWIADFLPAILHGDDEHRAWLKEAFHAFADGKPIPKPRGKGTSEIPGLNRK